MSRSSHPFSPVVREDEKFQFCCVPMMLLIIWLIWPLRVDESREFIACSELPPPLLRMYSLG